MYKENLKKVKKYLFFISVLFIVLLNSHLFYLYLYDESKQTPIEWGVVSEWIIWEYSKFKFNPLMFSKNQKQDYILSFLYRWLLTYDAKKKKIVSDLAKCDYTDLSSIKCVLDWDFKWSNWEKITAKDVLATYKIIKDKGEKLNKIEYSYLKNANIYSIDDKTIIFKVDKKDTNFVTTVLFQPIVSEKTLQGIWEKELFWKFDLENSIFSWEYVFDSVVESEGTWIMKMKLKKNPYYTWKKSYISSYVFKFSSDPKILVSNVNIFDNKDGIVWKNKLRFKANKYYLPNFSALFINADKIKDEKFRWFLFSLISRENIINLISKTKKVKEVENPYFLTWYTLEKINPNFSLDNQMKTLGFYKKADFLKKYLDDKINTPSTQENTSSWSLSNENTLKTKDLKYIISDKITKNINFISQEVVLEWKLNQEHPKKIIINHNWRDIELKSLAKNNYKKFYFALREDYNTLSEWKNVYKLYFDDKNDLKEVFYVFYNKDLKKLEEYRKNAKNIKETKEEKESEQKQDQEKISKIENLKNLDDNLYYDENLKPFTLTINYIDNQENNIVVEDIIKKFKDKWIILKAIPINLKQLIKKISSWKKDYDLLLTKINLSYFKFNISRYFYSWASKSWFNFSNIRSSKLDTLLEELNSQIVFSQKEKLQKQYKVLDILKEKQVVKTLFSIENNQLVDKIIQNYSLPEEIPNYNVVRNLLKNIYTKSQKQIDWDKKNLFWYINFLKNIYTNKK